MCGAVDGYLPARGDTRQKSCHPHLPRLLRSSVAGESTGRALPVANCAIVADQDLRSGSDRVRWSCKTQNCNQSRVQGGKRPSLKGMLWRAPAALWPLAQLLRQRASHTPPPMPLRDFSSLGMFTRRCQTARRFRLDRRNCRARIVRHRWLVFLLRVRVSPGNRAPFLDSDTMIPLGELN